MNAEKFSQLVVQVFKDAQNIAIRYENAEVTDLHLTLAILRNKGTDLLKTLSKMGVNLLEFENKITEAIEKLRSSKGLTNLYYSRPYQRIIINSEEIARNMYESYVRLPQLFLAILREDKTSSQAIAKDFGIDYISLRNELMKKFTDVDADGLSEEQIKVLSKYGRNLTLEAKEGKLDPIIGRDEETLSLIRILSRRIKNNPVLIGEAGVGKTAIVDYMPAPIDVPDIKGVDPQTDEPTTRKSSDEEPFAALAFKIATDPYVGKLAFTRIYSGTVESGSYVYNSTKGKRERIGRILMMHANKREEIDKAYAGDIVAIIGLKDTTTGDTLCDMDSEVILENMEFPDPVISVAIEPKTKASQEKMGIALAKLAEEDPTFRTYTDEETGDTIISGMGELHLEIIVDRLLREFKVEANIGNPQVAYRESITQAAEAQGKYVKQSGGRGQYGDCTLRVEPLDNPEESNGIEFVNAIVGGAIPKEYIPSVQAGAEEAAQTGILGGYPMLDMKITLLDGSYHDVDSSEMAYKIAGSMGFRAAVAKAKPILLEPAMKVEITTPDEYLGDVMGDVSSRRGKIDGMNPKNGVHVLDAFIPLAEMFGYATDLRSKTQGRATYSMQMDHYEQVPNSIAEEVIGKKNNK